MKRILGFLSILFVASVLFLLFPSRSFAANDFITSFDVTYTVNESGMTHAVFSGSLKNVNDSYYASSYAMQTGFDDIEHATAYDQGGSITPILEKTDTGTTISLKFNTKTVGSNNSTYFTFAFDSPNVATHTGSIWEINIPGIANATDFNTFTVHLKVPSSFGNPVYIKPAQLGDSLDFPKEILGNGGISLAFGKEQHFDFTLSYHLKNSELFPVTTDIALPPTTNYQDVAITELTPKPLTVVIDPDGNWLAKYKLLPGQTITVLAKGTVALHLDPKKETLSAYQRKLYTQQNQYWQQNDQIKQLAKELGTPEAMYEYVVNHLHYDFSRVAGKQERLGAANVLQDPQSAVCLEFTDLFIALARAAGIPAREIDGYAYTQNTKERPLSLVKDILHAWPEYYDDTKGAWVMIDPTWGNTTKGTDYFDTLDFDHFAFVVKGSSSTYPVPAGGYKITGAEKDVFVSFGQSPTPTAPRVTIDFTIAQHVLSGTNTQGILQVQNISSILTPQQKITIHSSTLTPTDQQITLPPIPPQGYVTVPVNFNKTGLLTNTKETITIQVGGNTIQKTIPIYPFFLQKSILILGGCLIGILSIGLFIITKRTRNIPVAGRKR